MRWRFIGTPTVAVRLSEDALTVVGEDVHFHHDPTSIPEHKQSERRVGVSILAQKPRFAVMKRR